MGMPSIPTPSDPDDSKAKVISQLLQANWPTGTSPLVSDIFWVNTRFEATGFDNVSQAYAVSCYNSGNPVLAEQLAREVIQFLEEVTIDVVVKVSVGGSLPASLSVREEIKRRIYDIIHANEFSVYGCVDVYPVGEPVKVEAPEHLRLTIKVKCKSFHVTS